MGKYETAGKSDDWYTPAYIFDALGIWFNMDVSAPKEGPRYVPCDKWLWEKGLEAPWQGTVWMNPPFGNAKNKQAWLDKFFAHGDGIALLPDRTSAGWFQDAARKADGLLFVGPRIKFERPDGTIGEQPGTGTVLMAAGIDGYTGLCNAHGKIGFMAEPYVNYDDYPEPVIWG